MIITDKLVILNFPKTGSTFVRKVLRDIYSKRRKKLLFRILRKLKIKKDVGFKEIMTNHPLIDGYQDQHGCYDQIPDEHKKKTIVSVVRDPYLRLESIYKFRWWVDHPPVEKKLIDKHFPNFPDLSINQYLDMSLLVNKKLKGKYNIDNTLKVGNQTIFFIRFYFKNHKKILANIDENYIKQGLFKNDLCNVTFLRNENLNDELSIFLSNYSFSRDEIEFIKNHQKVNVTKSNVENKFLDQEIIDHVNEYEWILFEILRHFNIDYIRK